jgi:hypothetical protein
MTLFTVPRLRVAQSSKSVNRQTRALSRSRSRGFFFARRFFALRFHSIEGNAPTDDYTKYEYGRAHRVGRARGGPDDRRRGAGTERRYRARNTATIEHGPR